MSYSKPIAVVLASVVCATVFAADVAAQSRGRSGGARSGGGRGPTVGRAVPRTGGTRVDGPRGNRGRSYDRGRSYGSRGFISSRGVVRPYRSYYAPYRSRFGLGLGFYSGYPYNRYPYSYGYPYAYGYPYGSYAYGSRYGDYPYGGYSAYGGYGYAGSGGGYGGEVYGGVRIQDAPRDAQVFVDGYYAGIVDDFDGAFQRLELEDGAHQIEIRAPGFPPMTFDVNVQPGRTLNLHVR